jgi:imidazolonepropionase-like amidohydrolase
MLAFVNANVIDGTGAAASPNLTVLVDGKKIAAVGMDIRVPEGATVIDLQGKALLPGLIESHAHLGGRDDPPGLDSAKRSFDYAPMRDYTLGAGVTTIRSCGDFMLDTLATRDKINAGLLRGPRMICSGKQFQRRDGHPAMTVWGDDPETCENAGCYPDTPEEARALVRELVEAGVDYIKIIVADSMVFIYPATLEPLADDILEAIVDEAHRLGAWVVTHVDNADQAVKMVNFGTDEIHHLISMGIPTLPDEAVYDELFRLMVEKGTWFVPTITIVRTWGHMMVERGVPVTLDDYFIPHFRGLPGRGADGLWVRFGRSGGVLGPVTSSGTQGVCP